MRNRKPCNTNRSRRLPLNCCGICGDALGNFRYGTYWRLRDWETKRYVGWGCGYCCGDKRRDEGEPPMIC